MKQYFYIQLMLLVMVTTFSISSCSDDDEVTTARYSPSTSVFIGTDRHENGSGNNLSAMIQNVISHLDVTIPKVVIVGGDNVGSGGGAQGQPPFSIQDVYDEVYRNLDANNTELLLTYGSHDQGCEEGYDVFFSGPHRCDGYYVYGISYAQMVYDTDSTVLAAVTNYQASLADTTTTTGGNNTAHTSGQKIAMYDGIDVNDRFGISAESGVRCFDAWVSSLSDNAPIIMMSHVPMHARRNDNLGGERWYQAISKAAENHDIILLFGHNHTLEEHGNPADQYVYLLTPGDSITVQGNVKNYVHQHELNFTYANAGYLKLGWASLITFSDRNKNGYYESMNIRRFTLYGDDNTKIGLTGKENPYTLPLKFAK